MVATPLQAQDTQYQASLSPEKRGYETANERCKSDYHFRTNSHCRIFDADDDDDDDDVRREAKNLTALGIQSYSQMFNHLLSIMFPRAGVEGRNWCQIYCFFLNAFFQNKMLLNSNCGHVDSRYCINITVRVY